MSRGGDRRRVFVAGHNGMVGRALVRRLAPHDDLELVLADRRELDLLDAVAVDDFFAAQRIDEVYLAAARVGGIVANASRPVEFLLENLQIQNHVIGAALAHEVPRLLFLGSSCIYPKFAEQPIREDSLLTGPLEPTNEPYAIAKIAGIKLCNACSVQYGRDYRAIMPTNLYGPHDNFHPEHSHVIPGLFHKFDRAMRDGASSVELWGSGEPRREFLHVDDMAAACEHVMRLPREAYDGCMNGETTHVNAGTGEDLRIVELARLIAEVVGFDGELTVDTSRPDGTPRKLLDVSALQATGWRHVIELPDGLAATWDWFQAHASQARRA